MNKTKITVETIVNAPVQTVWEKWTNPKEVKGWNNAGDDWHTPSAENDLRVGGKFNYLMAAKDGSFQFDFWGVYTTIETNKTINYTLGDDRKAWIDFEDMGKQTKVTETFEAEDTNPVEMQKTGWQMILDNFKKYVEANS